MTLNLPVKVDMIAGDANEELKGHPGHLRLYFTMRLADGVGERDADVCCPGCGQMVVNLPPGQYPLEGPTFGLSVRRRIDFDVCCGWSGWLHNGMWVSAR